ncbi:flavin reductase family protein [Crystallibacter degradans]|uniref:flavin reductase family protein n=1 Tax=Crystallibacter degradans TaxID=2726743 RepID=UPI0014747881|nr:flavin reductase family protein [Arthrobacter sp. SF27]NMR31447.1 flavin reductase [Arthrobacter sp. SF27]
MSTDVDTDAFVSGLDYPMYIVTAASTEGFDTSLSGCLVGFATQCSISPVRFMVCISKQNRTYRVARNAKVLGVHVPGSGQRELAALFGENTGDEVDKFGSCNWREGPGGVPVLTDCPRRMIADVLDRFDLGDHVGFLLAPSQIEADPGTEPLQFSQVLDLDAGHSA